MFSHVQGGTPPWCLQTACRSETLMPRVKRGGVVCARGARGRVGGGRHRRQLPGCGAALGPVPVPGRGHLRRPRRPPRAPPPGGGSSSGGAEGQAGRAFPPLGGHGRTTQHHHQHFSGCVPARSQRSRLFFCGITAFELWLSLPTGPANTHPPPARAFYLNGTPLSFSPLSRLSLFVSWGGPGCVAGRTAVRQQPHVRLRPAAGPEPGHPPHPRLSRGCDPVGSFFLFLFLFFGRRLERMLCPPSPPTPLPTLPSRAEGTVTCPTNDGPLWNPFCGALHRPAPRTGTTTGAASPQRSAAAPATRPAPSWGARCARCTRRTGGAARSSWAATT